MAIERDIKVLYLDSKDLEKGTDVFNVEINDFKYEIYEQIKDSELVIYSTAGVVPKIIKNKW